MLGKEDKKIRKVVEGNRLYMSLIYLKIKKYIRI